MYGKIHLFNKCFFLIFVTWFPMFFGPGEAKNHNYFYSKWQEPPAHPTSKLVSSCKINQIFKISRPISADFVVTLHHRWSLWKLGNHKNLSIEIQAVSKLEHFSFLYGAHGTSSGKPLNDYIMLNILRFKHDVTLEFHTSVLSCQI